MKYILFETLYRFRMCFLLMFSCNHVVNPTDAESNETLKLEKRQCAGCSDAVCLVDPSFTILGASNVIPRQLQIPPI